MLVEKDGGSTCVATLGAEEIIGEMAVFEQEVRSASVRARGPVRALTIDRKNLMTRVSEDPTLAFRLIRTLCRRIRALNEELTRQRGTPPSVNQPIEQPAVVFIDLADSTHLYHELGDAEARELTGRAIARWEAVVTEHCGRVIKRIGDELLCVFPEPAIATRAAMALQASLNELNDGPQLHAKVGLHAGPVLEEGGDIYGDTVNLAARMVQHAHPREILTTRETVDLLPALHRMCTRLRERAAVKGIPGEIEIFEVVWEKADLTAASSPRFRESSRLRPGCVSAPVNTRWSWTRDTRSHASDASRTTTW